MRSAVLGLLILAALGLASAEARSRHRDAPPILNSYAVPDPLLTPGGVDPAATLDIICSLNTKAQRNVTPATRAKVLRDYNEPPIIILPFRLANYFE